MKFKLFVRIALLVLLFVYSAVSEEISSINSFNDTGKGIELDCSNAYVSLEVIAKDIVRVRVGVKEKSLGGKYLEDYSYAVREDLPASSAIYNIKNNASSVVLSTEVLDVVLNKAPLLIDFVDKNGFSIISDFSPMNWKKIDHKGSSTGLSGVNVEGHDVVVTKKLSYGEHFYGLGEKTGKLDKRRAKYQMWNTDAYGYGVDSDPLYQSHPFFIGLKEGKAYGVFFDNSYRTHFDMGNSFEDRYIFSGEGGEIDYYIMAGSSVKDVIKSFSYLTGYMPMPPKWALGHMLCRYSYFPDKEVIDIVTKARQKKIPLDVIWLDIDYMDEYRIFTWDKSRFPDLKGMIDQIHGMGCKVVSMIDPGVKVDPGYFVYDEGIKNDYFVKYPNGELTIGPVWPGDCVFPDFTNPKVRNWWGGLYKIMLDVGIDGFWNDMNEPAVFVDSKTMDDSAQFYDFGLFTSHRKIHNVYGINMIRGTFEGVSELMGDKRSFVLSRAGFSGIQRYGGATWTGDNTSNFDHLKAQIPMFLNMGMSGTPFMGSDIGGFVGSADPELLTRWYQASALVPLMREHTGKGSYDQEPWVYGEPYMSMMKKYINLRYKLLPYIYTAFYEASITGAPIIRPLLYEYQNDENTYTLEDEFLVGKDILVAPVVEKGADKKLVYLPEGNWYDYESDQVLDGGKSYYYTAPLHVLPLFVKEGAIIASKSVGQYVDEVSENIIDLHIYPRMTDGSSVSSLYMDDGVTKKSAYSLFKFKTARNDGKVEIDIEKSGSFKNPEKFNVIIHSDNPGNIKVDGSKVKYLNEEGKISFGIGSDIKKISINYK